MKLPPSTAFTRYHMLCSTRSFSLAALLFTGFLAGVTSGHAATFTFGTTNASGANGFSGTAGWIGGLAPVAGNDYIVPGSGTLNLRTANDSTLVNTVFAGDSLTLGTNGSSTPTLSFKGGGTLGVSPNNLSGTVTVNTIITSSTLTISSLTLNKGIFVNSANGGVNIESGTTPSGAATYDKSTGALTGYTGTSAQVYTKNVVLAGGTLTLGVGGGIIQTNSAYERRFVASGTVGNIVSGSAGAFVLNNKDVTILSNITGSGVLTLTHPSVALGTVQSVKGNITLSGTNNYTGGTTIGNDTNVIVNSSFGSGGNVTVTNLSGSFSTNGSIVFNINTGMDPSQFLILGNSLAAGSIDLNFGTDTMTIAGLSLDGGTTFVAPGVYGSVASGAATPLSVFDGTGTITVVPEPSVIILTTLGATVLLLLRRRRAA